MSGDFQILIDGFRYDLWANRLWMEFLDAKSVGDPDRSIFRHVLAAQEIWLRRCQGESPTAMPEPEISNSKMLELNRTWIELLSDGDDPVIAYRTTNGEAHQQPVTRIARHVIDHGTYHRGELRGLCLARDEWKFPETGLMGYYRSHGLVE